MTKKERETFIDIHKKVTKTHQQMDYLLNKIQVDGQVGLEPILAQHHSDIQAVKGDVAKLKDRGDILWTATEVIRAKADFWRSWKRLSERSRVLSFFVGLATHKIVGYTIIAVILVSIMVTLGYNVTDAIERVYRFFTK